MNALEMLRTSKTVAERAESFFKSIKRELQKEILDTLVEKKEKIEDEIFELSNFTLDTNHNRGLAAMTKNDCKIRFEKVINLEFELDLVVEELTRKQASYDKYFSTTVSDDVKEA